MANPHNLQVGQKLWYVASERRDQHLNCEVEIASIGREWATLTSGRRIHLETLCKDGGKYSSPGTCYLSRDAWEVSLAVDREWDALRRAMTWSAPKDVTPEAIREARRLLGLEAAS